MALKRKSTTGSSRKSKKRRSVVLQQCLISDNYQLESFAREFRQNFTKKPFPFWQLRNFIDNNGNMVEMIEDELQNFGEWSRKENDLYSLYQTNDLKSICPLKYPNIYSFRQFLYKNVREWLQKTSGVELTEQVDCNGSCYAHTDGLLPHNDLIETRRFAFVYYLTSPNWKCKELGGALQLFNSDDDSNPTNVCVELEPTRNSLVLFEVSQKSWHRVAEMIGNEPRLSINGWFHSTRRLDAKKPPIEHIERFVPGGAMKMNKWVNEMYLEKKKQEKVQSTFADSSELNLTSFLKEEIHDGLYEELEKCQKKFKIHGPPSKRRIARIEEKEVEKLKNSGKFLKFLKSKGLVEFLEKVTGVTLKGRKCSLKMSRVEHRSYWVIGDEDAEQSASDGYCLDVHIFVQKDGWSEEAGGEMIYIAEEEEEELLRVTPSRNSTSMIFREPGVMSFLKYANCQSADPYFLFTLSFYDVNVVED